MKEGSEPTLQRGCGNKPRGIRLCLLSQETVVKHGNDSVLSTRLCKQQKLTPFCALETEAQDRQRLRAQAQPPPHPLGSGKGPPCPPPPLQTPQPERGRRRLGPTVWRCRVLSPMPGTGRGASLAPQGNSAGETCPPHGDAQHRPSPAPQPPPLGPQSISSSRPGPNGSHGAPRALPPCPGVPAHPLHLKGLRLTSETTVKPCDLSQRWLQSHLPRLKHHTCLRHRQQERSQAAIRRPTARVRPGSSTRDGSAQHRRGHLTCTPLSGWYHLLQRHLPTRPTTGPPALREGASPGGMEDKAAG